MTPCLKTQPSLLIREGGSPRGRRKAPVDSHCFEQTGKSGASAGAWDIYIFAPPSHNNKMFRSKPRPPPTTPRGTPFPRGGACPHWGCIFVPHCHVAWAYIMLPTRDVVWGITPHTTAGFAALHLTDSTAIFSTCFHNIWNYTSDTQLAVYS